MSLKIFLLGQFRLQTNDLSLELPSRPAQSLLAYLTLNAGVTHRREKLANLLWPEATETNARSYLRQALWRIRKSLESGSLHWEDYLKINDISVTFNDRSDYWLDANRLLEMVEGLPVEEIIEMVSLYRGELLPGFYDEWIALERDRLQAAYHQKMNTLEECLIQAGRWEEALEWSEGWIRLGHSPEPAFRALMSAYAGLGDQGMVSATYRRCVESLDRELCLGPSPETIELYERIREGAWDGLVAPSAPSSSLTGHRPPFLDEGELDRIERPIFVAREGELSQLEGFLNLVLGGQGRVVFVTGEAGSGKTALVEEFSWRAQETHAGLIVASGNCNAHTGIGDPYLPFRELLEMLTGDVGSRWAAGAISRSHACLSWEIIPDAAQALLENSPDLIDTFVPGAALLERAKAFAPGGADWLERLALLVKGKGTGAIVTSPQQSDLFEQYTRVLQALAHRVPLVLVVDDLQWADLGSISLLFHLGRNLAGCRILIVGSYRPEEVAMGRGGERHPLEPVVNEFQRVFGDPVVNVDRADSHEFLEAILDSEPNVLGETFREMLYQQTHGQPLFTTELLRGMQERGDLVRDQDGRWVEGPALDWEMLPARVEAVFAERVGRLPRTLQDALRVACVEGETFTAEVVARLGSSDDREILRVLSGELDRRHRLIHAQSIQRINSQLLSSYRFRHFLFQKYLYSTLDPVERVHLHEQVGNTLEEFYEGQEESVSVGDISPKLARHFQEAGIGEKTIRYLRQAGERAVRVSAYQEGIAHLKKALTTLMSLPESPERDRQEADLQLSLGIAGVRSSIPTPESRVALDRARELCLQTGKTSRLALVLSELSVYYYVRAEYRRGLALGEQGFQLAQEAQDLLLEAVSHWQLGVILFALGEYEASRKHLDQMISYYDPQRNHRQLITFRGVDSGVSALAYKACCLWCLGYPEQALRCGQEVLALARELGHAFSLADVICFAGCMLSEMRGDVEALKVDAAELMLLSTQSNFPGWVSNAMYYRGSALVGQGQIEEGIAQIKEGIPVSKSLNVQLYMPGILGHLAVACAKVGDLEEGLARLMEAFDLVEQTDERHWEAELYRYQAELLRMQGDDTGAEASLMKALECARRGSARSWELRAATDLARMWHEQGRVDEARTVLGEVYTWFTEGFDTPDLKEARKLLEELS